MIAGGIVFIVLGVLCIVFRAATLAVLAVCAGIGFVCAGVWGFSSYRRLSRVGSGYRGWMLFEAIFNLVLGILFIFLPSSFGVVLPWTIGIGVLVVGVLEAGSAFKSRSAGSASWGYDLLVGVLTIVFGVLMLVFPGLLSVLIGAFLVTRGVIMVGGGIAFGKLFA